MYLCDYLMFTYYTVKVHEGRDVCVLLLSAFPAPSTVLNTEEALIIA